MLPVILPCDGCGAVRVRRDDVSVTAFTDDHGAATGHYAATLRCRRCGDTTPQSLAPETFEILRASGAAPRTAHDPRLRHPSMLGRRAGWHLPAG